MRDVRCHYRTEVELPALDVVSLRWAVDLLEDERGVPQWATIAFEPQLHHDNPTTFKLVAEWEEEL